MHIVRLSDEPGELTPSSDLCGNKDVFTRHHGRGNSHMYYGLAPQYRLKLQVLFSIS